jgi:hypothetical protein
MFRFWLTIRSPKNIIVVSEKHRDVPMNVSMIILFIAALVVCSAVAVLVAALVPAINQLRTLLLDLEKTSVEVRDLTRHLKHLSIDMDERLQRVDSVIETSRDTVEEVSSTFRFINENVLRRTAGLLSFLPAVKLGWTLVKKIKGGHK